MGIVYKWKKNDLIIEPTLNISPQIIDVWPQTIQSDHQPFFALLLTFGKGVSVITDHVWNNRYHYINNLNMRKTKCSITVSRLTYEDYLKFRNLQFDRQNQIAHKERSEYKKKRERLLQLYEKARHNTGWKNPDGIASSDGHAKKSMQAIVSKGKRFEREKDNFTEIPDRETGIITKFDSNIFVPSQKRIIDIELPELKALYKTSQ